jgi:tetratricopeptide (TPR) repeat protein
MGRPTVKRPKKGRRPGEATVKIANGRDGSESSKRRRQLGFRLIAAVLLPLGLLVAVESILRLAGFGYPTSFFLERAIDGSAKFTDNLDFGRRFFPPGLVRFPHPQAMPAVKPPGSIRVFVFGESAALGDPDPRFGVGRMLEVLLRARYPDRPVQVMTVAMVAINSHVLLPVARECARREGDLWVIYMGNNEMIGPFGAISTFGSQAPPLGFIRASLAAKTTRLGQLVDTLLHSAGALGHAPKEWQGMAMWLNQRLQPSDPKRSRVYEYFQRNLRDILQAGTQAGVPILLCTVPTNLKDCAPFASVHSPDLSADRLAEWDDWFNKGVTLQNEGRFAEAEASYERALNLDAQFAELSYRSAQCSQALGQVDRAHRGFADARDRDALQFRADSRINQIIRETAASHRQAGVCLLDVESLFNSAAPRGSPGRELFFEHVHLNPDGNYLLARAVAGQASSILRLGLADAANSGAASQSGVAQPKLGLADAQDWLSETNCLAALGFTEWSRYDLLTRILDRIKQAPFIGQANHAEEQAYLARQIEESRGATKPYQIERAARLVTQALEHRPDDPDLHWLCAELLEARNDLSGAEEQWRAVIHLLPYAPLPRYTLGRLLETRGEVSAARQTYRQCLELQPDHLEARRALDGLRQRAR